MSAKISQMVVDLFEAWNEHDVERAASLYSPSYKGYDIGRARPDNGRRTRGIEWPAIWMPSDLKFKTERSWSRVIRLPLSGQPKDPARDADEYPTYW
jgi:hypothetical protein